VNPLTKVRRAAAKAAQARHGLDEAIREARAAGLSLREIAKAAGLSPEWVRRIAQGS
jgi:DNA-binding Lrp family transcriptional regulator